MSILDRATEEQVFAFNCDRFTSEVVLETIQSKEYREDFARFIKYVLDTVQNLILDCGLGEGEFNLDWYEYKGLFPFDLLPTDDFSVYNWIEKTILAQANSVLRFVKVSISLDGMGFVSHSQWRNNTLCFVMDSVIDERRNQDGVE
jgi:hypothetical protein